MPSEKANQSALKYTRIVVARKTAFWLSGVRFVVCVSNTRQEGMGLPGVAMSSEISASSTHWSEGGKENESLGRMLVGKEAFLGCFLNLF